MIQILTTTLLLRSVTNQRVFPQPGNFRKNPIFYPNSVNFTEIGDFRILKGIKIPEPVHYGNDIFYNKKDLKKFARTGVDISNLLAVPGVRQPKNRALIDHVKWYERKVVPNGDIKTVLPWSFHADFPHKDEVRQALTKMNKDLTCIANLEVPTEKMGQYHHGVLITWGDQTGGGCWSTTGIAEGFNGFANKSGISNFFL